MVVTGIFHLEEEELAVRADSNQRSAYKLNKPFPYEWSEFEPARRVSTIARNLAGSPQPSRSEIYEEKIAEHETLVAVRARSLHQARLLLDLLRQAGAQDVAIDAEAA